MPSPQATRRARPALRSRLVRVLVALLGTALLVVAVASAVSAGRQAASDELDHALQVEASARATALQEYFERAHSVNLLLAHDSAFRRYEPRRAASPPTTTPASDRAAEAMAYLEELYPGRISEACLIDATGTELARVVEGDVAHAHDLSTEEASNPFFGPTMRLPQGRVYQAAPYVSPDTDKWVISNSTPMVSDGETWGLVHFEVDLASFLPTAPESDPAEARPVSAAIVDSRTGEVVLAGGAPFEPGALDGVAPAALRALTDGRAGQSTATVGGRRLLAVPVPVEADNANRWSVVSLAPAHSQAWYRSVGPAPVSMAVAAILLLLLAGLSLRASQREVHAASLTDDLTGLPNRRLLADRLGQALLLSRRRGTTCAVMLIDLDRFKEVNDTLGHQHGDELLRCVANRLIATFRESDTVARLGGDEFAVLMPEVVGEAAVVELARRCVAALHEPFLVDGIALSVEASVGVALAPQHAQDADALMRAVDVAMYEAKERKGRIVVYDPALDVHTPTRLALLGDLRRALQRDELVLHYQPKVDVATDEVRSVEALVRWHHPQRGLVPPGDFVPLAEGTGLILPLTLRTLDVAIGQARSWLDGGRDVQIAVNLSPRCLLDAEFAGSVRDLLDRHGLPARLLRLEITETAVVVDPARSMLALAGLRALGVALSIDDFGTGYSSMSYLKRMPLDELKIDRSFVAGMLANASDMVLVRSCIDLGHNLGMSVVAEGVEDPRTLAALQELGCDVVQGYHLARPMTAADADAWLIRRGRRAEVGAAAGGVAADQ